MNHANVWLNYTYTQAKIQPQGIIEGYIYSIELMHPRIAPRVKFIVVKLQQHCVCPSYRSRLHIIWTITSCLSISNVAQALCSVHFHENYPMKVIPRFISCILIYHRAKNKPATSIMIPNRAEPLRYLSSVQKWSFQLDSKAANGGHFVLPFFSSS